MGWGETTTKARSLQGEYVIKINVLIAAVGTLGAIAKEIHSASV
jgi:hypothetical protein